MTNKNQSLNKETKNIRPIITGNNLLNTPLLNKGTAFTKEERKRLGLLGKLPLKVEKISEQITRTKQYFDSLCCIRQKRLFLTELHNTNQTLFFKLIKNNLEEMVPIIYTPYVADSCSQFSEEFRWPYGAYISYPDRNKMKEMINNTITDKIKIVVVTDGERILGIGDQGIGGINISIGKLILYTLFAGIDPQDTLPVVLDVGTNNTKLLKNHLYLGWRHKRLTGPKYYSFVNRFVSELKKKNPNILLHWEDFGKDNAWKLLELYRNKICSFNDDIQGTAAVTLAAILGAIKTSKKKINEQKIVILGAGSAAIGIVSLFINYLEHLGYKKSEIIKNIWLVDQEGLITDQTQNITKIQKPYLHHLDSLKSWPVKNIKKISLHEVIKNVKPTILLGCSTTAGAFNEQIVKEMAKHVKQPIIFPLSNPTANAEAKPSDLIKWTKGKALIATGSPFPPVKYNNKIIPITQCNNALIFPGIGLGVIKNNIKKITDQIFFNAAETLHKASPLKDHNTLLLPPISKANKVNKRIVQNLSKLDPLFLI